MRPSDLDVADRLRIFYQVQLDGGSERDGMWAALAADRAAQEEAPRRDFEEAVRYIVSRVCRETGVARSELLDTGTRRTNVVHARWVAIQVLRARRYSLPRIGAVLGFADHTTALRGLREIHRFPALVTLARKIGAGARVA